MDDTGLVGWITAGRIGVDGVTRSTGGASAREPLERRLLGADEVNRDAHVERGPTPIRGEDWPTEAQRSREASAVAQGEAVGTGACPQAGDDDGVLLDQWNDVQKITDESLLLEAVRDNRWLHAGISHPRENFSVVDDVDVGS